MLIVDTNRLTTKKKSVKTNKSVNNLYCNILHLSLRNQNSGSVKYD